MVTIPNIDLVGTLNSSTSYQGRFGGFIENPLLGLETESNNYSIQFSWPLVAGGIAHSKEEKHMPIMIRQKNRPNSLQEVLFRT